MGPHLICDKSTIQGLAPNELSMLRRYYSLNIPPVLMLEILGDLKKADDAQACQKMVMDLSNRLVPASSRVNVEFRDIVLGEMSGSPVQMAGVPTISGGRCVTTREGQKGMVFDEQDGDTALLRWQVGQFLEAEELLAERWRTITKGINLIGMQAKLRKAYSSRVNLKSLDETEDFVDDLMASGDPSLLVNWFLDDVEIGPESLRNRMKDISKSSRFNLSLELPYTAFCIRTALLFHFGLAFQLIGTRSTNRIDMEYFYYTPFCGVFSSGDNIHRDLAPHILKTRKFFISRDDLKADLKRLVLWWNGLNEREREEEKLRSGPPENDESPTHKFWKCFMRPGYREAKKLKQSLSPDQEKKLMAHIKKQFDSSSHDAAAESAFSLADCDFVKIPRTVRVDAPCICGSDQKFIDCCGSYLKGEASHS